MMRCLSSSGCSIRALLIVVMVLSASSSAAQTEESSPAINVAQLMRQWRFSEARTQLDILKERYPEAVQTQYLSAEMFFLDGLYSRALSTLQALTPGALDGQFDHLLELVQSTEVVTRGFTRYVSSGGHFHIYHPPGKDEVIVELAGNVLEAIYEVLGKNFAFYPSQPVRVEILAQPSDLAKLSPLTESEIETSGTIALCKYGKLMVVSPRATIFGYPWMDTLAHEYVHYVIASVSYDTVPVWLHEGLARFEQNRWRSKQSDRLTPVDSHLLADALKSNSLISFDDMHPSMAKLPSQRATALAFAEVHSMIGYLHEKIGYAGFRRSIEMIREGKTAREAIATVLQTRWADVESQWKRHLRRARNLKTDAALQSRAQGARIRFRKGSREENRQQGDENIGVDEVTSAKARKHARLGGMLRARGMSSAAAIEYSKALKFAGQNDSFIAGKLSRTYLELERYDDAIKLATPLIALDENDATPATTLGIAHLAQKSYEKAKNAFELALRVSPFDPAVRCGLREVYQNLDSPKLAAREQAACQILQQ